MKNLIYRQRAIERELETTISNNLQIASKVERLQLQLQVYQEEKVSICYFICKKHFGYEMTKVVNFNKYSNEDIQIVLHRHKVK